MRKGYIIAGFFTRLVMLLVWHRKLVHHERIKTASGAILASNHISYYDPPFIGAITPFEIGYLAKAELFKNPALRSLITYLNAMPIVRGVSDIKGMTRIMQFLSDGKSLLLFPEGTRRGKSIKPGVGMFAMKTQKDIVPIYIENADKVWQCIFFIKRLKIAIGEPIKYETFASWEQTKENYQKLSEEVYQKIMELKSA